MEIENNPIALEWFNENIKQEDRELFINVLYKCSEDFGFYYDEDKQVYCFDC